MRQALRGYVQILRCKAPADAVWRALVEPASLALWCAEEAQVEGRVGGHYSIRARLFGPREAHIDAYEPNRRLRLILHPSPGWPAAGNEVIIEDFMIDSSGEETVLHLIGSGVPDNSEWDAPLRRLRAAWAVAFAELKRHLASQSPGNPPS